MSEPIVWKIDKDARCSYEHERFYVATIDGVTVRATYSCGDWWVMACDSAARAVVAAVKVLRWET